MSTKKNIVFLFLIALGSVAIALVQMVSQTPEQLEIQRLCEENLELADRVLSAAKQSADELETKFEELDKDVDVLVKFLESIGDDIPQSPATALLVAIQATRARFLDLIAETIRLVEFRDKWSQRRLFYEATRQELGTWDYQQTLRELRSDKLELQTILDNPVWKHT
jgi:hypothetical protein